MIWAKIMTWLPISSELWTSFDLNWTENLFRAQWMDSTCEVFCCGVAKNFCPVGRDLTAFKTNLSSYPGEMELTET